MVQELRGVAARNSTLPPVVLVHPASPAQGDAHFEAVWSEAVAIADPRLAIYKALGRDRGRWWEIVGPPAWGAAARAVLCGYLGGIPRGAVTAMSGLYVFDQGAIVWSHVPGSSGDHPDFARLPEVLARALDARHPGDSPSS